jgi:hypothetical protein
MAVEREVLIERPVNPFDGMRISWGGIFGGVLAGVGTLLLLTTLGLAIGISAVDPQGTDGSTVGTGAAVWTALTLLIALFVGGWASTRLSMLWERTTAMFEGALVWVLSMIVILYLTANGIGIVAGSALRLAGNAAQTAATSVGGGVEDLTTGDVDQMLARLRDPQTATQLSTTLGVPRAEVSAALANTSAAVERSRNDPAQAAAEVRRGMQPLVDRAQQRLAQMAARAQPGAARTAWLTFAALLLSLGAAIAGAAAGRRNVVKKATGET